ncbi:MAG TPA: hypothetical protein VHJ20_16715 [Polyangia bacterium]|nr:hypothetical protein [Polyangia bacterium]
MAFSVLVVGAVSGALLVGCGGGSSRNPNTGGTTGSTGGTGGNVATGGTGGTVATGGSGGDTTNTGGTGGTGGVTPTGGTGGTVATGGAGGAGGTVATGGAGGTGGDTTVTPAYCDTHTNRQLPYNIATDFKVIHILSNNNSAGYWKVIGTPDCSDNPTYPPFTTDAGADGGADASADAGVDASADASTTTDAGDDTATLALDPDAGDGGVADAAADAPVDAAVDAPADAPVDSPVTDAAVDATTDVVASNDGSIDAGVDAGPALPACYEFSYDPDGCVGNCWAGVVFQVNDVQGPDPATRGVCIANGAMSVEFYARSSKDGVNVKFGFIGENNTNGLGNTETTMPITTTWTKYTLAIPAQDQSTYNLTSGDMSGVWNAFSVVVDTAGYAGGAYIEVKDIRWLAQ